jgi:peptide/nickel transport system permease protein
LGQWATEEALADLRLELGLNRPAYVQYLSWLGDFVRFDWGISQVSHVEARPLVMQRLRNSAMLGGLALLMYGPLGILLGTIAALNRDKWFDQIVTASSMTVVGIPEFVVGLILITVFSFELGWLPANSSIDPGSTFRAALPQLILPAITVSLINLGYIIRMTRASVIDVLRSDYTRTAELKGLPRTTVLFKHVLRNALLPTITVLALGIGWLIGGLIVTEAVFGYPGIGRLLVFSIQRNDVILIQACSMIVVIVFSLSNLLADLLYSVLNPRIRLSG